MKAILHTAVCFSKFRIPNEFKIDDYLKPFSNYKQLSKHNYTSKTDFSAT